MGDVTLGAKVSDGTVTITGVLPEGATVTGVYIHGTSLKNPEETGGDDSFKLNPDTPSGTYPLTVVIEYNGIAYSAVIDIKVENPDISAL